MNRDMLTQDTTENVVKPIAERWASMDAFLFAKRYPDSWIDHAKRDIQNLIAWLGTEQAMHAAWRKRAEEAEAQLDPPVCRLQFPDGSVPGNAREAAEGWKRRHDEMQNELNKLRGALRKAARESNSEERFGELVSEYALPLLPERV